MESYSTLPLDTHAPIVNFDVPPYCAPGDTINIVVEADEPLGNWQSISMVNARGEHSSLTFLYDDGKFYGSLTLNESDGYVIFTYQFMDEVGNFTEVMTSSIQVFPTMLLYIINEETIRPIDTADFSRVVDINISNREIIVIKA